MIIGRNGRVRVEMLILFTVVLVLGGIFGVWLGGVVAMRTKHKSVCPKCLTRHLRILPERRRSQDRRSGNDRRRVAA